MYLEGPSKSSEKRGVFFTTEKNNPKLGTALDLVTGVFNPEIDVYAYNRINSDYDLASDTQTKRISSFTQRRALLGTSRMFAVVFANMGWCNTPMKSFASSAQDDASKDQLAVSTIDDVTISASDNLKPEEEFISARYIK